MNSFHFLKAQQQQIDKWMNAVIKIRKKRKPQSSCPLELSYKIRSCPLSFPRWFLLSGQPSLRSCRCLLGLAHCSPIFKQHNRSWKAQTWNLNGKHTSSWRLQNSKASEWSRKRKTYSTSTCSAWLMMSTNCSMDILNDKKGWRRAALSANATTSTRYSPLFWTDWNLCKTNSERANKREWGGRGN